MRLSHLNHIHSASQADLDLDSYDFDLPEAQIAQYPPEVRGASRLMVLERSGAPLDCRFEDLAKYLPEGALLVANNSRVGRVRLLGKRAGGGKAEFLLLTPLPLISRSQNRAAVDGLIRPAAKIAVGDKLTFDGAELKIAAKGEFGACRGLFAWTGDLDAVLEKTGRLPLPPYIRREPEADDESRYQTVYASKTGSAAAPTAGLHFTPQIRANLAQAGFEWAEICLHVGYGTFSPVRCRNIKSHQMHSEYVEIDAKTAAAVNRAKKEGRPVVAIGTTSARALEGVAAAAGKISPFAGMVNIFLYPGAQFRVIDALLTNFHLPRSTLLMLVSAFAGRERILAAYEHAARSGYRFFSYGDAMLIK